MWIRTVIVLAVVQLFMLFFDKTRFYHFTYIIV